MNKFRKDERGSSLVMTIIAATFISLLAVAVISMTVTNIKLKQAQKKSQTNFYNADSIVDAIKAGVENVSDTAARDAYESVYAAYGAVRSGSTDSLTGKYSSKYFNAVISALSEGDCDITTGVTNMKYHDSVIRGFLTEAQSKYSGGNFVDGYKSHVNGKGDMEYDRGDNSLLLKDLTVIKTEGDYQTTITTDIRVNLPEMKAGTHSEYLNYALIADNKVKINGGSSAATIDGDVYSGTVRRDLPGASPEPNVEADPEAGFVVDNGAILNINAENIISRGDILVRGRSYMRINGLNGLDAHVWVENIQTKASSTGTAGNVLKINAETNVSDDLEIWGNNDNVTFKNSYCGYNYNKDYSAANIGKTSDNAQFSSAMVINGKNVTLDIQSLSKLILSGKTFISKKGNKNESLVGAGPSYAGSKDIRTGEALTVKSSQVAYYVPSDYWKKVGSSGPTFPNGIVFTPIEGSTDEYEFDVEGYNEFVGGNKFDVRDYIDSAMPLVYYYRHDTDVKADALTYFYLNVKEDKLTSFYQTYAKCSPDYAILKDVNAKYMSSTGIKFSGGAGVFCATGNILYRDGASGQEKIEIGDESPGNEGAVVRSYAAEKSKEYMSLQMSLTSDYDLSLKSTQYRLSDNYSDVYTKKGITNTSSDKTNLFAVLLDEGKIADYESKSSSNPKLPSNSIIVVKKGDYTWNGSEEGGIIVATGNVKLEKNFKGLIIAGGDIEFSGATKVVADSDRLEKIFDNDTIIYNMFSKYFRKTIASSIAKDDSSGDNGICYENWKKN